MEGVTQSRGKSKNPSFVTHAERVGVWPREGEINSKLRPLVIRGHEQGKRLENTHRFSLFRSDYENAI